MPLAKSKRDPNNLDLIQEPGEDPADTIARSVLRPTEQAAITLKAYGKHHGELDLMGLIKSLEKQCGSVKDGDLGRAEEMLTAQAHTLDAIFNKLALNSVQAAYLPQMETYLKLGLRAQSQCRATWEALSTIKNPPIMGYVKQANIAQGHQQVNNGLPADDSRAEENQKPHNELLEKTDGERLDTGTTSKTGRVDPAMATLGEVDRAENR